MSHESTADDKDATDESTPVVCQPVQGFLTGLLEVGLIVAMSRHFLPVYAGLTVLGWLIEGRQSLTWWQLPIVVLGFCLAQICITLGWLWSLRAVGVRGRGSFTGGQVLGSTAAWWIVSLGEPRAALVGFAAGWLLALATFLHGVFTKEPSEDEVRSAMRHIAREFVTEINTAREKKERRAAAKQAR